MNAYAAEGSSSNDHPLLFNLTSSPFECGIFAEVSYEGFNMLRL